MCLALAGISQPIQAEEFRLSGTHKEYYEDGRIRSKSEYKDGKLDGYVREYHPNGQLAFVQRIQHGKINGPVKAYYPSGKLQGETMYVNNSEDGPMREYYENGVLKEEALYIRGQLVQVKTFDTEGRLVSNKDTNLSAGCVVVSDDTSQGL
ncbi:MAG: toxin-antitoxin system YwqK family antitoxin [Candidatus Omnitrophica bacterium]|nr:toxin-antitoxin system YwqK family antitoxin [Candidatus Omnitrophota bacterium]